MAVDHLVLKSDNARTEHHIRNPNKEYGVLPTRPLRKRSLRRDIAGRQEDDTELLRSRQCDFGGEGVRMSVALAYQCIALT